MDPDLLENLFILLRNDLIGSSSSKSDVRKIFRVHNNKLNHNGDFSFPLNLIGWQKYAPDSNLEGSKIADLIQKYENRSLSGNELSNLVETCYGSQLSALKLSENKILGSLNRLGTFQTILRRILTEKSSYGKFWIRSKFLVKVDDNCVKSDLNGLRLNLVRATTEKLLDFCLCDEKNEKVETEFVLTNSSHLTCDKKIVCGPVTAKKNGPKNTELSSEEYFKKRTLDMQLMAQHKYGLRVSQNPGWSDFFKKLGDAAVKIDILHVKINKPVIINENCTTGSSSRGASFILYNCARLSEIFKNFDKKVESKQIGPLPEFDEIDLTLLNQEEEWEILFVYLLQLPNVLKSCLFDADSNDGVYDLKLHNLCIFLDGLSNIFSVYYRRVRILTESRPHLLPTMYARIYLLKSIEQVFHNVLSLLNITPVKQM